MTSIKPVDRKDILIPLKEMLSHTRNDLRATPDVSGIMPFVRDVLLEEVVIHCRGNQAKASRLLGINRGTLRTHMARIHMKKLYEKRRRPNGT